MIGETISHYKILEKLGEGGMGVVYKAQDVKLDRYVAIKILPSHLSSDEEAIKRFINEAKTASSLDHAHIGTIHEVDETPDGLTFIVMAYYEGETLRERIDRGDMSLEEALELTAQVAMGLSKAHAKGIIHRDIKPSNVIITPDGEAKLVDFGLAKLAGATRVTKTGTTLGTVAYMSPEQARGDEVDARSDIWALGVMLYEMLTGKQPFRGDYEPAVVYSIMNEEPEAVSATRRDMPVEIENIVDKAITKDLSQRFQTAEELLSALETQRGELKLGPKGRGLLTMRRKARQRLLRISIPAVLIVAAIILIIVFQPFEIEIRPKTKEAIAREYSIVVLPFENVMDPADTDNDAYAITSALTDGLRASEYMQVVSSERVHDVLKQLDREDQRQMGQETAKQVAERTGSNWILTGKLYQTEPNIVVSAKIANAVTGEMRGKTSDVRGEPGETILDIVDHLKSDLGKELALPQEAMEELDRSIKEVTTNSPDAYRYYLEGVQEDYKMHWEDAISRFEKAIEHDSSFAMAYINMAKLVWVMCQELDICKPKKVKWCMDKAKEHSGKLTEIQKRELEGWEAMIEGNHQKAKEAFLEVVRRDPQEKIIWNWAGNIARAWQGEHEEALGYYYKVIELDSTFASGITFGWISLSSMVLGDDEKAEWAAEKYLSLAPDDVQANWVYGVFLAHQGRINEAIDYYERCEKIKPGAETGTLIAAYIHAHRYEQADSILRHRIASSEMSVRRNSRREIAHIRMMQGKLDQALGILDDGIAADRIEKQTDPWKHHLKARILVHKNRTDAGIRELETVNKLTNNTPWSYAFYVSYLPLSGKLMEAEDSLRVFRTRINEVSYFHLGMYEWSRGMLELANGNPDFAAVTLEKSVENLHRRFSWIGILPRFYLAKAYLEVERPADAARAIESLMQYRYAYSPIFAILIVKSYYLAGLIYEQLGDDDKAIAYYEEFLEIWKDADSDLEEVPDARRRLALLKEQK
jgi:serine/threonine protein kinase/tetratricopeptide (TPR) repeat protein